MQDWGQPRVQQLLPSQQADWFLEARAQYLAGRYADALQHDEKLLSWAEQQGHLMGRIMGNRFVGLCHFRLEALDKSEQHLRRALDLAREVGCYEQVLLCANHLGATLRRQGKLGDAHRILEEHLEQATFPRFLHERARLHGSFGALLDELGQRAAADDHYARMEELCELIGDPDRLANARGLAARSADLRGDQETALHKYEQERGLAEKSGSVLRQIAATLHMAKISLKLGRVNQAKELCRQGLSQAQLQQHQHIGRLIDAWECQSEVQCCQGQLAAASQSLCEAQRLATAGSGNVEKRANIAHKLSQICHDAGLHGEALHHLMRSVELRWDLYKPLRGDKVHEMAKARMRGMEELARGLLQEACHVVRSEPEKYAIRALIQRIRDLPEKPSWDHLIEELRQEERPMLTHERSSTRRSGADRRWRKMLLPESFDLLLPDSQEDLILSEICYSSDVDHLQSSAHLLARVVERELRERLIPETCLNLKYKGRKVRAFGFGDILELLDEALTILSSGRQPDRLMSLLIPVLAGQQDFVRILVRLRQPLLPLDGSGFLVKELRNAVAHGEVATRFPGMNRLTVDALKRALVLDDDPPLLARLAVLPLPQQSGRRPS